MEILSVPQRTGLKPVRKSYRKMDLAMKFPQNQGKIVSVSGVNLIWLPPSTQSKSFCKICHKSYLPGTYAQSAATG